MAYRFNLALHPATPANLEILFSFKVGFEAILMIAFKSKDPADTISGF